MPLHRGPVELKAAAGGQLSPPPTSFHDPVITGSMHTARTAAPPFCETLDAVVQADCRGAAGSVLARQALNAIAGNARPSSSSREEGGKLLAPIVRGSKIDRLASNSKSHIAEQGKALPKNPNVLSSPLQQPLSAEREPDVESRGHLPGRWSRRPAAVVGQRGKHIPVEKAMDVHRRHTIALDMGYRDLHDPEGTVDWVMGKGFDGTMAVGPWVVPKEEVGEPYPLAMELKVGGTVRQLATPPTTSLSPADPRALVERDHLRARGRSFAR